MYECFDSGHASFIMYFTHSLLAYFSMQSSLVMEHLFAKVNNWYVYIVLVGEAVR